MRRDIVGKIERVHPVDADQEDMLDGRSFGRISLLDRPQDGGKRQQHSHDGWDKEPVTANPPCSSFPGLRIEPSIGPVTLLLALIT